MIELLETLENSSVIWIEVTCMHTSIEIKEAILKVSLFYIYLLNTNKSKDTIK